MINPTEKNTLPFSSVLLKEKDGAAAAIYNYGAHLSSWVTSAGKEWIFLSKEAKFENGVAIRGGVPIIFPQFNAFGSGARHGFARKTTWQLLKQTMDNECCFSLSENEITLNDWPYPFDAQFNIKVSGDQLNMALSVRNKGDEPFSFTCALHTYFSVDDINECNIHGLEGLQYWDNDGSDFSERTIQESQLLQFSGAIDRVYFDAIAPLTLVDKSHKLSICMKGFRDVVVWNPGQEAAKKMDDFADYEHNRMLCIEAATIDQPIVLAPGETWKGSQILTDESRPQ